jgi:hypothetical protein
MSLRSSGLGWTSPSLNPIKPFSLLQVQVKALSEENERLRRDNERFVRLIDSGEWGRGRVAELVSAGEVRNSWAWSRQKREEKHGWRAV